MSEFVWQSTGTNFQWIENSGADNFSNFEFVDQHFIGSARLRRIFSLTRRLGYKGIATDEIDAQQCQVLREEAEDIAIRKPNYKDSRVKRIFFFAGDSSEQFGELLGYAVFKEDSFDGEDDNSYVFEAILPPIRNQESNNFIHSQREYKISCELGDFSVSGVLFAKQNGITNVCSTVSLRELLSTILPDGDISYRKINELAGIDITASEVALDGNQIVAVLKALKFEPLAYPLNNRTPAEDEQAEFQAKLYGILESGGAALLGFSQLDEDGNLSSKPPHMISVLGHTFNEDSWAPVARMIYFQRHKGYYSSELWLSNYVVHDDNMGPYYCVPRHFLTDSSVSAIIGVAPQDSKSPAYLVEATVAKLLDNPIEQLLELLFEETSASAWQKRLLFFQKNNLLILRTLSVSKSQYLDHLESSEDWGGNSLSSQQLEEIAQYLPAQMWMVEISVPELFTSSRRKVGEVIVPADIIVPEKRESFTLFHKVIKMIRIPDIFLVNTTGDGGADTLFLDSNIKTHSPLFEY